MSSIREYGELTCGEVVPNVVAGGGECPLEKLAVGNKIGKVNR